MPLSYAELERFYERFLPVNPLRQHGLDQLIAEAQVQAARLVPL